MAVQQQGIEFVITGNASGATRAFRNLSKEMHKTAGRANSLFKNLANATKPLEKAIDNLGKKLSSGGKLGKVLSALKRIAYYRLIRSAIRAVTEAFSEGLKNAYAFSKGLSDAIDGRIAVALDGLTSSALKMKNQLGAAFGSLLVAIAPALNSLIALVTRAANAITQLFAAFSGGTYLKAKDVSAEFADNMKKGAGSAKEWKNQLMGFDVINRLEEPSSGGSGSSAAELDPSEMFEVKNIDSKLKDFVDSLKAAVSGGDWRGVGTLLGQKVNSIIENVEWANLGLKIGRYFNGAIQSAFYTLKEIDFVSAGTRIAEMFNGLIGEIDFTYLGGLLAQRFLAAIEFLGSFIGHMNWGQVGFSIGNFLRGALNNATEWIGDQDWQEIANTIKTNISDFIAGLDPESLKDSLGVFFRAAFDALFEVTEALFPDGIIPALASAISDLVIKAIEYIKTDDFKAAANVFRYKVTKSLFGEDFANRRFQQIGDYVGKDIVLGMINGIEGEEGNLSRAVTTSLVDPTIAAAENGFEVHSPSRVFKGIGENVINGFLGGMQSIWGNVTTWFDGVLKNLIGGIRSICEWIQSALNGFSLLGGSGGGFLSGLFGGGKGITAKASGGYVQSGDLFLAQERGPELVGRIGNRTAVANNDQITEGIKEAVYEAMISAMSGGSNGQPVVIMMDGKEIARTTTKYQNQMARAGAY